MILRGFARSMWSRKRKMNFFEKIAEMTGLGAEQEEFMSNYGKESKSEKLYLFRPALFWDADIATLDPETHARYIIGRVITRGI